MSCFFVKLFYNGCCYFRLLSVYGTATSISAYTSYEQAKNFPKIKYEHPTGSWYFIRQTSQFKLTSIEKKNDIIKKSIAVLFANLFYSS